MELKVRVGSEGRIHLAKRRSDKSSESVVQRQIGTCKDYHFLDPNYKLNGFMSYC